MLSHFHQPSPTPRQQLLLQNLAKKLGYVWSEDSKPLLIDIEQTLKKNIVDLYQIEVAKVARQNVPALTPEQQKAYRNLNLWIGWMTRHRDIMIDLKSYFTRFFNNHPGGALLGEHLLFVTILGVWGNHKSINQDPEQQTEPLRYYQPNIPLRVYRNTPPQLIDQHTKTYFLTQQNLRHYDNMVAAILARLRPKIQQLPVVILQSKNPRTLAACYHIDETARTLVEIRQNTNALPSCDEKEKTIALYEIILDIIATATESYPQNENEGNKAYIYQLAIWRVAPELAYLFVQYEVIKQLSRAHPLPQKPNPLYADLKQRLTFGEVSAKGYHEGIAALPITQLLTLKAFQPLQQPTEHKRSRKELPTPENKLGTVKKSKRPPHEHHREAIEKDQQRINKTPGKKCLRIIAAP